jgi:hypothetical protein
MPRIGCERRVDAGTKVHLGRTKGKKMNLRRLLIGPVALAVVLAATPVRAVPSLQLDILGGTYVGGTDETVYATGNNFHLFAFMQGLSLTDNYFLSMALVPPTAVGGNYGSFTVNGGSAINVTSGMDYGNPPVDNIASLLNPADAGDLPPHGVFPTYFTEQKFKFSASNVSGQYDTQSTPGLGNIALSAKNMYYAEFVFDISGLAKGTGLHMDLYSETVCGSVNPKNCSSASDIDVNKFAPFSHDAQGMVTTIPEPETYAMLLAGLGLMGFVARRRSKRSAA